MNETLLKQELLRYEGCKYETYLDTEGLLTAGVGHLLSNAEKKLYPLGTAIPKHIVDNWFNEDVGRATKVALSIVGQTTFNRLDEVRQRVVVNLAFNLGNRLKGFRKFLADLDAGDYSGAADNMIDSKWYTQVGRRGPEMVHAMRFGFYSWQ